MISNGFLTKLSEIGERGAEQSASSEWFADTFGGSDTVSTTDDRYESDEFEDALIFDNNLSTTDFYADGYEHGHGHWAIPVDKSHYETAMDFCEFVNNE